MKFLRNLIALFCVLFFIQISFAQEVKTTTDPTTITPAGTIRKNSIGMEFFYVPPGDFMMGSSTNEIEVACAETKKMGSDCKFYIDTEKPEHKVTIKNGFWIGRFEVTQEQWTASLRQHWDSVVEQRKKSGNYSKHFSLFKKKYPFKGEGPKYPMYNVSWEDAKAFIEKMNAKNDGFVYSLPSEAEWEYACRAGTKTVFAFGDVITATQANFVFKGRYIGKVVEVGSYQPNAWGVYDMHGNVSEWCEDLYNDSYVGLPTDGTANSTIRVKEFGGSLRVNHGGSWNDTAFAQRSAFRGWNIPNDHYVDIGFRVVARVK